VLDTKNPYEINTHDDTVINYSFEIDPLVYDKNVRNLNDYNKINDKKISLDSIEGTRFVNKYVNFELGGVSVEALDRLECPPTYEYIPHISGNKKDKSLSVGELVALSPFSVRYETESLGVILDYVSEPYIALGETKTLRLTVWDMNLFNTPGEWAEVRIYADPGVALPEGGVVSAPLMSTYKTRTVIDVPVTLESATAPKVNVVFDISVVGRSSNVTLKATLFPGKHKTV
jgi:hypothetical protein